MDKGKDKVHYLPWLTNLQIYIQIIRYKMLKLINQLKFHGKIINRDMIDVSEDIVDIPSDNKD